MVAATATASSESSIEDNVTIDAQGTLVLPPEVLDALRAKGETLTLVDIEVQGGVVLLRRSTIPDEDWWAYTPDMRERLERARNRPRDQALRLSRQDLERHAGLDSE